MAKKSRKRIGMAGAVLALILPLCGVGSGVAAAGGLPMRAAPATHDRAMASLTEGLDFKLTHFHKNAASAGVEREDLAAWTALVEDTLLIAARLGCVPATAVTAQRAGRMYAVALEGDSRVSGADPDRVLGRLLFMLAHAAPQPGEARTAAALAVLDQPLSATLAALPFTSSP